MNIQPTNKPFKMPIRKSNGKGILFFALILLCTSYSSAQEGGKSPTITDVSKINPTTVEVLLSDSNRITFDFYGENIFRLFQDNSGRIIRDPEAKPEAQILVNNPRKTISEL
ncbi:MAG: hypothetical protein LBV74_21995, partial [Tannerella sp.]|nr:hypothetical protein [Tannerella sp.]